MPDEPSDGAVEATFHEVIFGEAGSAHQQRYSFNQFRRLNLRHRVRLLMNMPSQFLSESGEEIPRDEAMRFRQGPKPTVAAAEAEAPKAPTAVRATAPLTSGTRSGPAAARPKPKPKSKPAAKPKPKSSGAGPPPGAPQDRVDKLIHTLVHSELEHELRGAVKLAETITVNFEDQRTALADGLLRAANLLEKQIGSTPLSWAAIRRFGAMVPTTRLSELAPFLEPGNEAETIQATLQTLWHALSVDQDFGLAVVAARSKLLLNKFLDPDWLSTPLNRALLCDLLLAYSVLAPAADETGLRAIYKRTHALADSIPIELVQGELSEALAYAREHNKPITARLELVAKLVEKAS